MIHSVFLSVIYKTARSHSYLTLLLDGSLTRGLWRESEEILQVTTRAIHCDSLFKSLHSYQLSAISYDTKSTNTTHFDKSSVVIYNSLFSLFQIKS